MRSEVTADNWSDYAPPVGRRRIGLAAHVLRLAHSHQHSQKIVSDPLHLAHVLLDAVYVAFPWDST